jgi:hypothetical protein
MPICGSTAIVGLGRFSSFLIYTQSLGLLGRGISHRKATTYTENNTNTGQRSQTSVPRVGIEATMPMFARAKTFHALDPAATVIS